MPDIDAFAPAHVLADAVRKKRVSAVELADSALARIERLDGPVNAVAVHDFERARREAENVDALVARGEAGTGKPLLGVPMTVKESFDLRGHPTTWGLEIHREHRAREDAVVVQKLRAAGAVILGKTNVPPHLLDWQSDNPVYGRTSNPYDLGHTPGGSSGGSAAALAMGFSALEVGSDIGGSIRVPAAFCGVFGTKPTFGIVSRRGTGAGGWSGAASLLSVAGPMARTARDLDLCLDVIAGPDDDAPFNRLALPPPRHGALKGYSVFVMDHHPLAQIDSEIRGALEDAADQAAREGANVARASSLLPDLAKAHRTYIAMLQTINTRGAGNPTRAPISAHDWFDLLDEQHRIRKQWAEFFRHFDVALAPAFSTTALPHMAEPDWSRRELIIDGEPTRFGAQMAWAGMATLGNLPSTAVPMGLSPGGLPLSLQVMGGHLDDRTTIDFAARIARQVPPPKLAA
jgi:amidase